MQIRKSHTDDEASNNQKVKESTGDSDLANAANKADDLLSRIDEATAQKSKGHYEVACCGIRIWIED